MRIMEDMDMVAMTGMEKEIITMVMEHIMKRAAMVMDPLNMLQTIIMMDIKDMTATKTIPDGINKALLDITITLPLPAMTNEIPRAIPILNPTTQILQVHITTITMPPIHLHITTLVLITLVIILLLIPITWFLQFMDFNPTCLHSHQVFQECLPCLAVTITILVC